MKQVVRACLPRDVCTDVAHLQREMGTIPIVAFPEVEVEVMYFLHESWLDTGMLHQELVKESGATLLCSDNEKVGQRSDWSSGQSPEMPGSICLLDAALHNPSFLSQVRTYCKPMEDSGHRTEAGLLLSLRHSVSHYQGTGSENPELRFRAWLTEDGA